MDETRKDPGARKATSEDRREQRLGLLAWLLLALLSICLIFACAQLTLLGLPDGSGVPIRSRLEADYAPWGTIKFGPLSPAILLDIIEELKLAGLTGPELSSDCLITGGCGSPTPAVTLAPTSTPSATETASVTPTASQTGTVTPTPLPSATPTISPTPTNTPTPTPLVYPVKLANPSNLDPNTSQQVEFTIYVINYGSVPPAALTTVCDLLPVGLSYIPGSADRGGSLGICPDGSGRTGLVWNVAVNIPQGSFERFTFQASSVPGQINAGDTLTNEVVTIGGNFQTAVNWRTLQAYTPTPQAVANSDSYNTNEDTALVEAAPGVLGNDINGDSASMIATPLNGSLLLSSDGGFTYNPTLNYFSPVGTPDRFSYQACAIGGSCDTTTVTINVAPVEDAPTVVDDSYSLDEDGFLAVPAASGVLSNDWDGDVGDLLRAYQLTSPPASAGTVSGFSTDGSFNFTPAANWFGTTSFTYQACDEAMPPGPGQDCTSGSVAITVNEVNDPPTAVLDAASVDEDGTIVINVLANDVDGDPPPNADPLSVQSVTNPPNGTAVINADFTITYTPDADFNGPDSFDYTISDGRGGTDTATVTVTVNAVDDVPTAMNDSATTDEDTAITIDVLANDPMGNNAPPAPGDGFGSLTVTSGPSNGSASRDPGNTITYTPNANWFGTDTFNYELCDSDGDCDQATVTVDVETINDAPVAVDDPANVGDYTIDEDDPTGLVVAAPGMLGNDTDVDIATGDSLAVQTTPVTPPSNGSVTLQADGSFTYAPNADYRGADSFVYQVCDSGTPQLCDTATATITITPVDDIPVANDDPSYATNEDATLNVAAPGVLGNDTGTGDTPLTLTVVSGPSDGGSLTLNDDGSFIYTPSSDFNGTTTFTYQITDTPQPPELQQTSAPAMVTITVNAVNDAPVAANDGIYTLDEDTSLDTANPGYANLMANDSDVDGDPLTLNTTAVSGPSNAQSFSLRADGTFAYTPNDNYRGEDSFRYQVCDNGSPALCDTATVDIFVSGVNDSPEALADNASTAEDTPVTIAVLANDLRMYDTPITVTIDSPPTDGSVMVNADNTITYTPGLNFNGSDSFVYRATDTVHSGTEVLNSVTATVDITITAVNDPPVAGNDSGSVDEDGTVIIVVLTNDSDVDGTIDPATVAIVSGPTNGTTSVSPLGTIQYTPNADFRGTDSFTYTVQDNLGATSNPASVSVMVTPVDDGPIVAFDDSSSTDEDNPVTIIVLGNDNGLGDTPLTVTIESGPGNGSVIINGDNTITYTPALNFNGLDTFEYRVTDTPQGAENLDSDTATVTITVNALNDAPVAVDDGFTLVEDSSLDTADPGYANLMDNDSDVDAGDVLSVTTSPVSGPSSGSLTLRSDGTFVYTPNADFNGSDSFEYQVCDNSAPQLCDTATVSISVTSVNDMPVANDDASYSTNEDTTLNVSAPGVLGNDTDLGDTPLNLSVVSGPSDGGSLSLSDNGSFVYTPAPDFNGAATFTYQIQDANGDTAQALVTITVNPIDDQPVAVDDSATTDEDNSVTIDVLTNDTSLGDGGIMVAVTSGPAFGSTLVNGDNSITYTPNLNFNGTDGFDYQVCDGDTPPDCDQANVSLTVNPINDSPTAGDDNATVDEDSTVNITVLTNDSDIDGSLVPASVQITSGPSYGTASANPDGTVDYTPEPDFRGLDSFTYTVNDDQGELSNAATVSVAVNPTDDLPVAASDNATTDEDTPVTIDVLANDSDLGDIPLTVTIESAPTNGSASVNGDNTITYSPASDFNGPDSFSYRVTDSGALVGENSQSSVAGVTVTVNAVNDPPAAIDDNYSVDEDGTVNIDVLTNDTDIDSSIDVTTVAIASGPSNGTASPNPDGTIDYTPAPDFNGADTFTYTVEDNQGATSAPATVSITVNPVNDPPAPQDDTAGTIDQGTSVTINVASNDSDPDSGDAVDPTSVAIDSPPSAGTAVSNGDGTVTYTHDGGPALSDSFTYQICDQGLPTLCATATVSVSIRPPVLFVDISPESQSASPGSSVQFTVAFGNSGPGTAYTAQVTASATGSCSVQTANPLFAGDLAEGQGGFVTITVTAPSGTGSSCDVSALIQSTNGIGESDTSVITTPTSALPGLGRPAMALSRERPGMATFSLTALAAWIANIWLWLDG